MRWRLPWLFVAGLAAVLAVLTLPAGAQAEKRIALVIGNGDYKAAARLPNPPRDAQAVAAALREVGFTSVKVAGDLSRDRLIDALRDFAAEAERADWAVIYYAGHGIELNGTNYLIPTDARLAVDRDVQFEAVPMPQALAAVEGAKKLRLLILDACRDNPFITQMKRSLSGRSIGRGLARVEPEGGVLVAYAAKEGQVALDGEGENSPFVSSLVKHLTTPGLEINRLFRRVRSDVLEATNRRQEPFVYGSLPDDDFFFSPPPKSQTAKADAALTSPPTPPAPPPPAVLPPADPRSGKTEAAPAAAPTGPAPAAAASPSRTEPVAPPPGPVASIEPAAPPRPALPALIDRDLVRAVQAELRRVGCEPGTTSGEWTGRSKAALTQFNRHAGLSLDPDKPDADALDAIKGNRVRVCPLVCPSGQVAQGSQCVAKACPAGQIRDEDGDCVPKARPAPVPKRIAAPPRPASPKKVVQRPEPVQRAEPVERPAPRVIRRAEPRPAPSRAPRGSCFIFNGQRVCE